MVINELHNNSYTYIFCTPGKFFSEDHLPPLSCLPQEIAPLPGSVCPTRRRDHSHSHLLQTHFVGHKSSHPLLKKKEWKTWFYLKQTVSSFIIYTKEKEWKTKKIKLEIHMNLVLLEANSFFLYYTLVKSNDSQPQPFQP